MADLEPFHDRQRSVSKSTTVYVGKSAPQLRVDSIYLRSIPGVLTSLAWVLAFASFVAVEVSKVRCRLFKDPWLGRFVWLEFSVATSWISLTIFVGLAGLQLYRLVSVTDPIKHTVAMKVLMIASSGFWGLLTLVSACLTIDGIRWMGTLHWKHSLWVAVVFALLEAFSLLGAALLLVLDTLNIHKLKQALFEGPNGKGLFASLPGLGN